MQIRAAPVVALLGGARMELMSVEDASISSDFGESVWRRRLIWVLRVTVFLQAVGQWRWMIALDSSPLFELLWLPADAGGWEWPEAQALRGQAAIAWTALACGALTLFRPGVLFTGPLLLLQLGVTVAMWRGDAGYPLAGIWPGQEVKRMFPFMTQALQMAAPAALMIVDPWFAKRSASPVRDAMATGLLRLATSITFCALAIEAGQHRFEFVDLIQNFGTRVFGYEVSVPAAEQALTIIALHNLGVAGLCMVTRSRGLLLWMSAWGLITAISFVGAMGLESGLHEALIRAPHCGGPLAVVLLWQLRRRREQPS